MPVPGPAQARDVPLLVLDVDGTIRKGKDELGRFVSGPGDVEVFPEAVALMRRWKERGGRVIGVSNQGGIALGIVSRDAVMAAMRETRAQAGGLIDAISFCPHHPQADDPRMARCWCRKPAPGLLIGTALALAARHGESYPPHLGLMAGDRPEDQQCAAIASMDFEWAASWRARSAAPG